MSRWNPAHYQEFCDERARPASDLAARIDVDAPVRVADLGCGPGDNTQTLLRRWPNSDIIGIDNSVEMIDAARKAFPGQNWLIADLVDWQPSVLFDVVFSNAALHWLPDHARLVRHLFSLVQHNGALAFQIPSNTYPTVRSIVHELSRETAWADKMEDPRRALTMEIPSFYYDTLADRAARLDIWETEYFHVLDAHDSIVNWISSTGLRPFLANLPTDDERQRFVRELRSRVASSYGTRADGKVLFPFRRTFVIAYN